jgi:hypothetical protein
MFNIVNSPLEANRGARAEIAPPFRYSGDFCRGDWTGARFIPRHEIFFDGGKLENSARPCRAQILAKNRFRYCNIKYEPMFEMGQQGDIGKSQNHVRFAPEGGYGLRYL